MKNDPTSNYSGDVYLYHGDIEREGYHDLSQAYEDNKSRKEKVCVVLITCGGNPDAAYRMARATNHYYKVVEILIPDICKSAGTLFCVGAHKLIFGDRGELGPLDIQLSKPDEMFENMSGLDIVQALSALEAQTLRAFRRYLIDIRRGSRIRTSLAADIAVKLADSFISPMASKIDPITLGEHQRAMQIAWDYGTRLSEMVDSLKRGALEKLLSGYPSHGFVIDRKEASTLFRNVKAPDRTTLEIYNWARGLLVQLAYPEEPCIIDVKKFFADNNNQENVDDGSESEKSNIELQDSGVARSAEQESAGNQQADIRQIRAKKSADFPTKKAAN